MTLILGIETSCDESAASVVTDTQSAGNRILSQALYSQLTEHAPYGGVVPEVASRAHMEALPGLVKQAMAESSITLEQLDGIAVTSGPGLIGGLIVGVMAAKGLAYSLNKPLISVNHLEGHALSIRLEKEIAFPFLLLLVSGGHCQIVLCEGVGNYTILGRTRDDALGEAFDKTAKMLGLGYPGGPAVEKLARGGDANRITLPRPLLQEDSCDFSFSGLKTAIYLAIEKFLSTHPDAAQKEQFSKDLCASFEVAVLDVLTDRLQRAFKRTKTIPLTGLVVAGGVAANKAIRNRLTALAGEHNLPMLAASKALCTDNAAMIGWAGLEHFRLGHTAALDLTPRPRWPLDTLKTA